MNTETNPFQSALSTRSTQTALGDVEQSRAIAETQAAMIIAKRFPRDPIAAMDRILNACTRPGLAEEATYTYSRGGTEVNEPSIRLAEVLAQNWGNMEFGIRELEQRDGQSSMQSFCWDIETNVKAIKAFQVRHERHTKRGVSTLTDPRDIYELTANQGARRLRACILGIIPKDVTEAAVKQCEVTLKSTADVTAESLGKLSEAFGQYGITKQQIEKRIQRRLDTMLPAQLVALRKIYNSLKDGMSKPEDWFETVRQFVHKPNFSNEPAPEINAVKGGASGESKAADSQETSGDDAVAKTDAIPGGVASDDNLGWPDEESQPRPLYDTLEEKRQALEGL